MKLRPIGDRVLVLPNEPEEKIGSIIIPDVAKEKPLEGRVVAVGSGAMDERGERVPVGVQPGERVLFARHLGTEIKLDGIQHMVLRGPELLGVLDED